RRGGSTELPSRIRLEYPGWPVILPPFMVGVGISPRIMFLLLCLVKTPCISARSEPFDIELEAPRIQTTPELNFDWRIELPSRSIIDPVVAPGTTTRPPFLRVRTESLKVAGPTWSTITSTPRRPVNSQTAFDHGTAL